MSYWLSKPVETLFERLKEEAAVDILIVGSGYGAAMSALALCEREKPPTIWVLERGEEYVPGDFPRNIGDLPRHVSAVLPKHRYGRKDALFDFRLQGGSREERRAGVGALVSSGLEGGSLINANVARRPDDDVLNAWPTAPGAAPWAARLAPAFGDVERMLRVTPRPDGEKMDRYKALARFGKKTRGGPAQLARIAVNFTGSRLEPGVEQGACIRCGNCVTGCNTGAKNTLNLNAWPRAVKRGVKIFTGVTVQMVCKSNDGPRWHVQIQATTDAERTSEIGADIVILAAGTFGSTEILLRTRDAGKLQFSEQLGKGFSTNGDSIVAGLGQKRKVAAIAREPSIPENEELAEPAVGPTIVGEISLAGASGQRYLVEDAVIPFALRRLFGEIVTTQGLLASITRDETSQWHNDHYEHDPVAVSDDLADHTGVYLVMGKDDATGEISLTDHGAVPSMPSALPYHEELHKRLGAAETDDAFDGGVYLPNPAWEILPGDLFQKLGAGDGPGRSVMTVHPLGGSCMGADVDRGVVDTNGCVYDGSPDAATVHHEGLYVLDGAIVPGALGVNPFLTIAALAYTLARAIPDTPQRDVKETLLPKRPAGRYAAVGRRPGDDLKAALNDTVAGEFRERLFLPLKDRERRRNLEEKLRLGAGTLTSYQTLVLDIVVAIPSIHEWLQKPDQELDACFEFSGDAAAVLGTVPSAHRFALRAPCAGKVNFGMRLEDSPYLNKHGARTEAIAERFFRLNSGGGGLPGELDELLGYFMNIVEEQHVNWRKMEYRIPQGDVRLYGEKILAYAIDKPDRNSGHRYDFQGVLQFGVEDPNPWLALLNLPFYMGEPGGDHYRAPIDFIRITRGPAPLQVTATPSMPETVQAMMGLSAFWLRALLQTHLLNFITFGYPGWEDKEKANTPRRARSPGHVVYDTPADERVTSSHVEERVCPGGKARLLRYQPRHEGAHCKPALLIHGLAQGSGLFLTPTIGCNLTQHLLGRGFDVWLLDYRTSAQLVPCDGPTFGGAASTNMDEIAQEDIPWAVKEVYRAINSGRQPGDEDGVNVFSHCIGSGCLAMAILAGCLDRPVGERTTNERSMIAALVTHAVTPWLYASRHNRLRANALAVIKDLSWFDNALRVLDPIPHNKPSLAEFLVDALAASLPWDATDWKGHTDGHGELGNGFSRRMCNRMTLFYGRLWKHANLAPETHKHMAAINGPAPLDILRQFHYSVIRGRLTDADGDDAYLDFDRVRDYWTFPTLFLHGADNEVIDVESSRRSAHLLAKIRGKPGGLVAYPSERELNRPARCAGMPDARPPVAYPPEPALNRLVGLQVVDGYGHLDMVFGKDAHEHVYPAISGFLEDPRQQQACYRVAAKEPVPAHAEPFRRPVTGPIISHPRADCGGTLSVWAEADEFVTTPARGLQVTTAQGTLRDSRMARMGHCWLTDVTGLKAIPDGGAVGVRVDYEDRGVSTPAQALRAPSGPASVPVAHEDGELGARPPTVFSWQKFLRLFTGRTDVPVDDLAAYGGDRERPLEWTTMPWFQRTFGDRHDDPRDAGIALSFAAGSCLYPGTSFEQRLSDGIFAGLYKHARGEAQNYPYGLDHVLLLGDQIYADATADLFDPHGPRERYRQRYQRAFGGLDHRSEQGRNACRLFSHVPTYFAVDDHEIVDDWQGPMCDGGDADKLFKVAREEALRYQMHHDGWGMDDPATPRLWYHFESRGYPFFVFDTRTERQPRSKQSRWNRAALVNEAQWKGFDAWLAEQKNAPLIFIASGSPMAPIARDLARYPARAEWRDDLLAYPGFLAALVEALHGYTGRFVWLSGDSHFSTVNRLVLSHSTAGKKVRCELLHIVASGLCAIVPFINRQPAEYDWDRDDALSAADVRWTVGGSELVLESHSQALVSAHPQHFVRIDARDGPPRVLAIRAYGPDGKPVAHGVSVDL